MYWVPNEEMGVLERLVARTGCNNNPAKRGRPKPASGRLEWESRAAK
jgi:hypothetical protein